LPDVALDDSAEEEAALVAEGRVPGLVELPVDGGWRLFRVGRPGPIGATALGPDRFTVARSGEPRVRFSPHWAVVAGAGCVSEAPGGWTRVEVAPGSVPVEVGVRVDPLRAALGRTGPRCSGDPEPE
ncbi:MAG TPA: hypothetical protein VIL49_01455, partial [Capillimicrobium sp.]